MRIMIRIFSFTIMGLCIVLMLMHGFDMIIRYDEVDRVSRMAMDQSQMIVLENIEDHYYKTRNARKTITSARDYLAIFNDNLNTLKTSDGTYSVDGYFNPLKGIAYANISYSYVNFLGQNKTINKKLVNIIDVVKYEENS